MSLIEMWRATSTHTYLTLDQACCGLNEDTKAFGIEKHIGGGVGWDGEESLKGRRGILNKSSKVSRISSSNDAGRREANSGKK